MTSAGSNPADLPFTAAAARPIGGVRSRSNDLASDRRTCGLHLANIGAVGSFFAAWAPLCVSQKAELVGRVVSGASVVYALIQTENNRLSPGVNGASGTRIFSSMPHTHSTRPLNRTVDADKQIAGLCRQKI